MKLLPFATIAGLCISLLLTGKAAAFTFTKIADTSNPLFGDFGFSPALNNNGTVVFTANRTPDGPANDLFIGSGGKTIRIFLANKGLNNANQLVFYARLSDGTTGIYRADPDSTTP